MPIPAWRTQTMRRKCADSSDREQSVWNAVAPTGAASARQRGRASSLTCSAEERAERGPRSRREACRATSRCWAHPCAGQLQTQQAETGMRNFELLIERRPTCWSLRLLRVGAYSDRYWRDGSYRCIVRPSSESVSAPRYMSCGGSARGCPEAARRITRFVPGSRCGDGKQSVLGHV